MSHHWFFCLWKPPVGRKECSVQETSSSTRETRACGHSGREELDIRGQGSVCSLHIPRVTLQDQGEFVCVLNQANTFRTARGSVRLVVATEARVSLGRRGEGGKGEGGVLEVTEGELVELECREIGRAHV